MQLPRRLPRCRFRWLTGVTAAALVAAASGTLSTAATSAASAGCSVRYAVSSQWPGGFTASVAVTNLGDPVSSWNLTWDFSAGQQVTQGWNATYAQSGTTVTAASATWDAALGTGGSAAIGFNGSWNNLSNPVPTDFALNGVACTGSATSSPSPSPSATATSSPSPTPSPTATGSLPGSFQWQSSGVLISPQSDATHNLVAIKDPSVVYYNGQWNVFASTVDASGNYSMVYLHFTNWSQASTATQYYLDQTPIGSGYKTAPQVFYFAPQNLWYLVYQTGNNAAYSTNPDITNPAGWSAPHYFYSAMPPIIQQNIGSGYWVDMWVICDSANCYLFSMDDNGHLYRSQTSVANFPNGMSQPVIAASNATPDNFFEADNVYKVAGTSQYLLIVEAIGSDGRRYFTAYTSNAIDGTWSALAATQSNPFARSSNTTFTGTPWTQDISSGEMIRSGYDQTLTISPCHLQYLYQGHDPNATGSYNALPWRIGMLTQTNSTC
jgi:endo-1,4-beta-xylanase